MKIIYYYMALWLVTLIGIILMGILSGCQTVKVKEDPKQVYLEAYETIGIGNETCSSGFVNIHAQGYDMNINGKLDYEEYLWLEFNCVERNIK